MTDICGNLNSNLSPHVADSLRIVTPTPSLNYKRTCKKPRVIMKVLSVHVKGTPGYKEIFTNAASCHRF